MKLLINYTVIHGKNDTFLFILILRQILLFLKHAYSRLNGCLSFDTFYFFFD